MTPICDLESQGIMLKSIQDQDHSDANSNKTKAMKEEDLTLPSTTLEVNFPLAYVKATMTTITAALHCQPSATTRTRPVKFVSSNRFSPKFIKIKPSLS